MATAVLDKRVTAPVKFDDRPGHVSERASAYGIREHVLSEGNRRFQELVLSMKKDAPAYFVDRDGAQRMANSQTFFVQKTTLGRARDNGYWIVGVGDEAGGSSQVGLLEKHVNEGSEVPKRRWPHNAFRTEN